MKILVVYFSLEGNTRFAARAVAEASGAEVLELVPESLPSSKGFSRYFWGGRSAMMKEMPDLKPFTENPDDYDLVFLGSPVWAWTFAPPLRSFLMEHDLSGKKVALLMCHGGGPGKAAERFSQAVSGKVVGELLIRDPLKANEESVLGEIKHWTGKMIEKAQTLS